ncbi:MAG: STAS domain-containing protein [Rhodospirillaceae bacterium]|nr:STAS domain-containing protein [Rhodospirillales bacterium]
MELKENNGRLEVELPNAVDLAAAGELRDVLLDALARDSAADVVLKAAMVDRASTAAIQVILAGADAFRLAARRLEMENAPEALAATFRHLGLAEDFDHIIVS